MDLLCWPKKWGVGERERGVQKENINARKAAKDEEKCVERSILGADKLKMLMFINFILNSCQIII